MRAVVVIIRKRDRAALTVEEIDAFIAGVTSGAWPDYQTSALLMAIMLNGMDAAETWHLTQAMLRSGSRVDLSDIPGPKVSKHSTGGVGDKVSILLAPLAAACGVVVPKISGRGLAHTGGTLDKLESIPGFQVDLSLDEFKRVLRTVGACIIGQTATLVPADKKIYGLRDVTATVESVPLICASIMSKKLAEGASALVLDVKCGSGAVMKDLRTARTLAESMVAIGRKAGLPTDAIVTSMDAPLGIAVGNALEVIECIETLKGNGPEDLVEIVSRLAVRMLMLGGVAATEEAAGSAVAAALTSGRALDRLRRMIEAQGGDPHVVDDYSRLPVVAGRVPLTADRNGYVAKIRAGDIGVASHVLGAGRTHADGAIDRGVGVLLRARVGSRVKAGDPLVELCHRDGRGVDGALALCRAAVGIGDAPPEVPPCILGEVR
jgi:pyrimidine-nucleoside phosphorylase